MPRALALFLTRGLIVLSNFLSMLLIAYLLGLAEYGVFIVTWTSALVATSILSLGAPTYALREMSIAQQGAKSGFSKGDAVKLVLLYPATVALALYILSKLSLGCLPKVFGDYMGINGQAVPSVLIAAFLINLNNNLAGAMRAIGWSGSSMAVRDALPQMAATAAAIVCVAIDRSDSTEILNAFIVAQLACCLAVGAAILKKSNTRPIFGNGHAERPYTISFWSGAILGTVWAQIDVVFGGFLMTSEQIGSYHILRRVANLAALPVTISTWAIVSSMSQAYARGDQSGLEKACAHGLKLSLAPGFGLAFSCILIYPVLVEVYDLPASGQVLVAFTLLLLQSITQVLFAPGMTMAAVAGFERFAVLARLLGILLYIGSAIILFSYGFSGILSNSLAILAGATALCLTVWLILLKRTGIDTSAMLYLRMSKAARHDLGL